MPVRLTKQHFHGAYMSRLALLNMVRLAAIVQSKLLFGTRKRPTSVGRFDVSVRGWLRSSTTALHVLSSIGVLLARVPLASCAVLETV